jgi:hypothetical protein
VTASLDFGAVQVGGAPATLAATLHNVGTATVNVTFEALFGPEASDFTVSGDTDQPLPSGSSMTFQVTFQPAAMGSASATLPLTVCSGCPESISLTGTGLAGQVTMSPNPIPASDCTAYLGGLPMQTNVVVSLSNTGSEALTIESLGILTADAPAGDFTVLPPTGTLPWTVAPDAGGIVTIQYTPSAMPDGGFLSGFLLANWDVPDSGVPGQLYSDPFSCVVEME